MEKPNVRFRDGQILSEEPLNKAMEAVDAAVEEANKVPDAVSAATSAATSAAAAASSAAAIQSALNEIKGSGDIPAATIAQVAELSESFGKLKNKSHAGLLYPIVYNKRVSNTTGQLLDDEGYVTSQFIPIKEGHSYGYLGFFAWYRADKTFIGGGVCSGDNAGNYFASAPADAAYLTTSIPQNISFPATFDEWNIIDADDMYITYDFILRHLEESVVSIDRYLGHTNLFTPVNDNTYVNRTNGNLIANNDYVTSDYIRVKPNTVYGYLGFHAWYDKNGNFISGDVPFENKIEKFFFRSPANAAYLRCSANKFNDFPLPYKSWIVFEGDRPSDLYTKVNLLESKINSGGETAKTMVVVDQNGGGDFTSIQAAIDSISDASEDKPYVVYVKDGLYDISGLLYIKPKNWVDILGESKTGTIIYNHRNTHDESVACIDTVGRNIESFTVSNLTLRIKNGKCCVHADNPNAIAEGGKISVKNCRLIHDVETDPSIAQYRGGVNVGLHSGQTVEIDGCDGNVLCYAHTSVRPTTHQKSSYFIVRNSNLLWAAYWDIDSIDKHYFICENNKLDYIGYGAADISTTNKNNIIASINNNIVERHLFINEKWFSKFPMCINSIHVFAENNTSGNLEKHKFVSLDNEHNDAIISSVSFHDNYIMPYDAGLGVYGYTLEAINAGDTGVIQYRGKILLDGNFALNSYISVDTNGNPIVGSSSNCIGRVVQVDQSGCWMKFK